MAASLTAETLAEIVGSMNDRVAKLQKAMGDAGDAAPTSPSRWPARRKAAAIQVLEPIGKARDFMRGILHKETKSPERPLLKGLFGDCTVVSHIHAVTDLVVEMLERSRLREDPRLQDAKVACGAVEAVLKESGLGAALARARAEAEQDINERTPQLVREASRAKVQSFKVESFKLQSFKAQSFKVQRFAALSEHKPLATGKTLDRLKMFADLDEAETDAEVAHAVEMLFMSYDSTGSCILEGSDYDDCISDIVRHIHKEADAVAKKRGVRKMLPDDDVLRQWVITVVDPNEDGSLTFEEAAIGFKAVVDDIETGEDYEKKKRTSMDVAGLSFLAEKS